MKLTTILFDLDGTLLPMDQDTFVKGYFSLLAKKLSVAGYDPLQLINSVWTGTSAMIQNDGNKTNEAVFWDKFVELYGATILNDLPLFESFYETDFEKAQQFCGQNPQAAETVLKLKKMGYQLVLATNPIFPAIATQTRTKWVGLDVSDFELVSTYENFSYCKPNLAYYQDILKRLNLKSEECLMVGNDVSEDMVAEKLGIKVFLLTDCLINKDNLDINQFPHGNFDDLMAYIESL